MAATEINDELDALAWYSAQLSIMSSLYVCSIAVPHDCALVAWWAARLSMIRRSSRTRRPSRRARTPPTPTA